MIKVNIFIFFEKKSINKKNKIKLKKILIKLALSPIIIDIKKNKIVKKIPIFFEKKKNIVEIDKIINPK